MTNLRVPLPSPLPALPLASRPLAPGAERGRGTRKHCDRCGMGFIPYHNGQRFCGGCREFHKKEYARQDMRRRYWADPVASRAVGKAWRLAHLEQFKATQGRYRQTPCIRCGKIRWLNGPEDKKNRALCGDCKIQSEAVWIECYWCEGALAVTPYEARTRSHQWHRTCFGSMTRAAVLLGITRERVRQLVNKYRSRNGAGITRKQALEAVLADRAAT